jgi:hypothetical protein
VAFLPLLILSFQSEQPSSWITSYEVWSSIFSTSCSFPDQPFVGRAWPSSQRFRSIHIVLSSSPFLFVVYFWTLSFTLPSLYLQCFFHCSFIMVSLAFWGAKWVSFSHFHFHFRSFPFPAFLLDSDQNIANYSDFNSCSRSSNG